MMVTESAICNASIRKMIRENMKLDRQVFVGVVAPIDPRVEVVEQVRNRTLEAAEYIPLLRSGTTGDCGFSPFCDDTSTGREATFAMIRTRVPGAGLAVQVLEGG